MTGEFYSVNESLMLIFPPDLIAQKTAYRILGSDRDNGIIGAGFLQGTRKDRKTPIIFTYYGGLLLLRGEGIYRDWDGHEQPLTPGCFAQRLPGKPHVTYEITDGEWAECFIVCGREFYQSLAALGCVDETRPVLHPGLSLPLVTRFRELTEKIAVSVNEDLPQILVSIHHLLIDIHLLDRERRPDSSKREIANEACKILGENLAENLHLPEVASRFHLSYERFRKLFRELVGMPPGEYRIRCRINQAQALLSRKDLPVQEVARRLGYPDQFAFSKQFRQIAGLSPRQFRETV